MGRLFVVLVGDAVVGRRLSPAAKAPLQGEALCGGIQHIFNENAISGGRIVNKDMSDGPHQFAVLDNGAAAHADVK